MRLRRFAAFLVLLAACSTTPPSPVTPMKNETPVPVMQGNVSRSDLESRDYAWVNEGIPTSREKLAKESAAIQSIAKALPGTEIEVYFGSWCSDSHDHLPTFLAILDLAKEAPTAASPKALRLIALDRKKNYPGYTNTRRIEKLPTFVFYRRGKEIGRIIETPEVSMVADMAKVLAK